MKILFIHGIGFHESSDQLLQWVPEWLNAIATSAARHAGLKLHIASPFGTDGLPSGLTGETTKDPGILYYENLIKAHPKPNTRDYFTTVSSLLSSGLVTIIGGIFTRDRGIFDISEELQWKAREVAAWADSDSLKSDLRQRVAQEITDKNPDLVIAHSYGGLILYDTCLFHSPDLLQNRHLITLGTQIGNPLLRREFGGYQLPIRCRHWFNLYNPYDKVFVSSLAHIRAENFTQIITPHQVGSGHDGATYLSHPDFAALAWPHIHNDLNSTTQRTSVRSLSLVRTKDPVAQPKVRAKSKARQPVNRALLVGIDRYTHPAIPTLNGCVNDTFQLSATLQEAGIDHREIRLIHNQHATRQNLFNHIHWLLADANAGDHRILSFSGHGHRRPTYDLQSGAPLEMHEILCTHDYDPSAPNSGLRDSDFQDLYANLPHNAHFTILLDCCHSGGITRAGSGPAIRSFSGPTDIEHESSKWNPDLEMWEQAPLLQDKLNPQFLPKDYHSKALGKLWQQLRDVQSAPHLNAEELRERETALYYGTYGDTRRIGRATPLRDLPHDRYDETIATLRKNYPEHFKALDGNSNPSGPYLPLVFMACGETEQASEYQHGAVSYGAFTYALTLTLRDIKHRRTSTLTYGQLLLETAHKLCTLGYSQTPDILGNPDQLNTLAPFSTPTTRRATSSKTRIQKSVNKKTAQ